MEPQLYVRQHGILYNLWENFVYSGNEGHASGSILRQIFFINTFSVIGFLATGSFGLAHLFEKNFGVALVEIIGAGIFFSGIIILRLNKKLVISKLLILFNQAFLLLVLLKTGGIQNTGIFWYFTFPVSAFFLLGRINGILFSLGLCISTLFVYILSSYGFFSIAYSFIEVRQMLVMLFVTGTLVYLYQNSIEKTEKELTQQTTQLKITKRSIQQARVEDEAILASIGEGMIAVGTSGRVLIINSAAISILNLSNQNIVGEDIDSLFNLKNKKGDMIQKENRLWNLVMKGQDKVNGEFICQRTDKTEFPISIVSTPVILNGQIIGVIELFRDITEEKKLDQAKSDFVALASHQLRTPISAISWFTEMLLDGDSGEVTAEQKDHLTQVYRSNQRMAKLVDGLLNVSRLEMGNYFVKPVSTDLSVLCHTTLAEEAIKLGENKNLEIKEFYDKSLQSIMVDQSFMKIIFQNIFSNAIKYTPVNGKIIVELFVYGQDSLPNGNAYSEGVLLKVSDTGYGIPKDQEGKIFTKLFRADNAKAKDTDGTGLGLYVVKSILDEVGGKIWFESEENEGTKFYVWLPKTGMKEKQGEKTFFSMDLGMRN